MLDAYCGAGTFTVPLPREPRPSSAPSSTQGPIAVADVRKPLWRVWVRITSPFSREMPASACDHSFPALFTAQSSTLHAAGAQSRCFTNWLGYGSRD